MNSKKTNRLMLILSFLLIIVEFYLIKYSADYILYHTTIESGGGYRSLYGIKMVDLFFTNISIVFRTELLAVAIPNIVLAIENKNYKRLGICQFLLGVIALIEFICLFFVNKDLVFFDNEIVSLVLYNMLPIILLVLQAIFVHKQREDIEENGKRKIINIILVYVIQFAVTVVLIFMILYSLIATVIGEKIKTNQENAIIDKMKSIESFKNEEVYIPVAKNYKFGYINKYGKEVIPCKYDKASNFTILEDNDDTYYFALVQEGNKYSIISKNNDIIDVTEIKFFNILNEVMSKSAEKDIENEYYYEFSTLNLFSFLNISFFNDKTINYQKEERTTVDYLKSDDDGPKYIYDDKLFFEKETEDGDEVIVTDKSGEVLFGGRNCIIYDNYYLVINYYEEENTIKFTLLDKDFNIISNEYNMMDP